MNLFFIFLLKNENDNKSDTFFSRKTYKNLVSNNSNMQPGNSLERYIELNFKAS